MTSLSNAIQSSRDLLYRYLINGVDLPYFPTQMNSTVQPTARSTDYSPSQKARPAKRTQIINIGISKRTKGQNGTVESCFVYYFLSIKGKSGKNCNQCDLWIHNKCLKLHVLGCTNVAL